MYGRERSEVSEPGWRIGWRTISTHHAEASTSGCRATVPGGMPPDRGPVRRRQPPVESADGGCPRSAQTGSFLQRAPAVGGRCGRSVLGSALCSGRHAPAAASGPAPAPWGHAPASGPALPPGARSCADPTDPAHTPPNPPPTGPSPVPRPAPGEPDGAAAGPATPGRPGPGQTPPPRAPSPHPPTPRAERTLRPALVSSQPAVNRRPSLRRRCVPGPAWTPSW